MRRVWDECNLPPSWFDERTPRELLFLFGGGKSDDLDPVAELHRLNHVVHTGQPPVVPSWFLTRVPRCEPRTAATR
jgi:hypothetical protein